MITSRRSFLTGLGAVLITAPAIVRAGSLMPVRQMLITDGIALNSITHPISVITATGQIENFPESALDTITVGNINNVNVYGIVVSNNRGKFFYGDVVSLRG